MSELNHDRSDEDVPSEEEAGATPTERYLGRLCRRSFLRLWSYQNIYRDQGRRSGRGHGKEVCDLVVIFGDHVITFSDKAADFPDSGDARTDWARWYRRAVEPSVRQLHGAERWIREAPHKLYLDRACTRPLPIKFPATEKMVVHRIAVAIGACERCRHFFGGGSGTLIVDPSVRGSEHLSGMPFTVGTVDPTRSFVHIFDDVGLDAVLKELDTIHDFLHYIIRRERLIDDGRLLSAAGEEELLALHVRQRALDPAGGFGLPGDGDLVLLEGDWDLLQNDPQYLAKNEANKPSYFWDEIIETVTGDALAGDLYPSGMVLSDTERGLRYLAAQGRFSRRTLAIQFLDFIGRSRLQDMSRRVVPSARTDLVEAMAFVFLCSPPEMGREIEGREARALHLGKYCLVIASKQRHLKRVVGIGTEAGWDNGGRSYDLVVIEPGEWTDELEHAAKEAEQELEVLRQDRTVWRRFSMDEFPTVGPCGPIARPLHKVLPPQRIGRNHPCPCNSGRKYKKCCGRRPPVR